MLVCIASLTLCYDIGRSAPSWFELITFVSGFTTAGYGSAFMQISTANNAPMLHIHEINKGETAAIVNSQVVYSMQK